MKVRELIAALEGLGDPEAEVCLGYDYTDRTHTTVLEEIEEVEPVTARFSDYHEKLRIDEEGDKNVVVLLGSSGRLGG